MNSKPEQRYSALKTAAATMLAVLLMIVAMVAVVTPARASISDRRGQGVG